MRSNKKTKLTKAATFYYNGVPEPCCVVTNFDAIILAKNLLTGELFFADIKKIQVRKRYSRKMMTYIRKCKTFPSRKQISKHLGYGPVTICRALKTAEPEIVSIKGGFGNEKP